ncbi:MAG TPA: hypothetical protein VF017_16350 [Thermoanaerobaculia bacterium]|nr:hypothetical protein [Thermoanaerobaculia bacterium]
MVKPMAAAPRNQPRRPWWLPVSVLVASLGGLAWLLAHPIETESPLPPRVIHPQVAAGASEGRPLVLFALEGFAQEQLDAAQAAGLLPQLGALRAAGRSGPFEVPAVAEPAVVWASLTTGSSPLSHGVLDVVSLSPRGELEPIASRDRRVPALWRIAAAGGKKVGVFGGWASWPAEPVAGIFVSERRIERGEGPSVPDEVFPPEAEPWVAAALGSPRAATSAWPGLPLAAADAAAVARDAAADDLARALAELGRTRALAAAYLEAERPELTVAHFKVFEAVARTRSDPARSYGLLAGEAGAGLERAALAELDRLVGEGRRLAEVRGAALLLAIAPLSPGEGGTPAAGLYALAGPGIEPDLGLGQSADPARLFGTALTWLGLPLDRTPEAPVLDGLGGDGEARALDYRRLLGPAPVSSRPLPPPARQLALDRLLHLGHLLPADLTRLDLPALSAQGGPTPVALAREGLLLAREGEGRQARLLVERAVRLAPGHPRPLAALSAVLSEAGESADGADRALLEAAAAGLPRGAALVAERARQWLARGEGERALRILDEAIRRQPEAGELRLARGRCHFARGACATALADLAQAAALLPASAEAQAALGLSRLCNGDAAGARDALLSSLALAPDQPEVRQVIELATSAR